MEMKDKFQKFNFQILKSWAFPVKKIMTEIKKTDNNTV